MLRVVKVEQGVLQGIPAADPRITVFKGVPFAAPPVGKLRFAPPQPPKKWRGVKECYKFSPIPVQPSPNPNPPPEDIYSREWSVDPEIPVSEDCLYLNVWTPAKKANEKLPVYFWIFGGGWQVGHTAEMEFDGERIARRGIVVVTVNYRVNMFGFTSHPEITAKYPDAPANMGLLDQQAGLKWVYNNIEAFGGDKRNITIGGQSAGGGSVLFQLCNKESRKYIKRAVVESGIFFNPFHNLFPHHTMEDAHELGKKFFEFIGAKNLKEAQKIPTDVLRKKWVEWGDFQKSVITWGPVYDDKFIKGDVFTCLERDKLDLPPLLIGYTIDEFLDGEDVKGKQKKKLINTIDLGIRKVINLEEKNKKTGKNYFYKFAVPIPGWDKPGDFHSVDLWFFFETLAKCWRPFTGVHYDVARQICDYLCNYIKTGDPNGKDLSEQKLPEWKPYSNKAPNVMEFTTKSTLKKISTSEDIKKYL